MDEVALRHTSANVSTSRQQCATVHAVTACVRRGCRQKLSGAREEVVEEQQAQVLEDVPLRAVSVTPARHHAQPFKCVAASVPVTWAPGLRPQLQTVNHAVSPAETDCQPVSSLFLPHSLCFYRLG